jgi:hypothetical protein
MMRRMNPENTNISCYLSPCTLPFYIFTEITMYRSFYLQDDVGCMILYHCMP